MKLVEFTCYATNGTEGEVASAFSDALRISRQEAGLLFRDGARVRVTAEQFAVFIVTRAQSVNVNQIKHLNAVVVDPAREVIDLTRRGI